MNTVTVIDFDQEVDIQDLNLTPQQQEVLNCIKSQKEFIGKVKITPEFAMVLMKINKKNRRITPNHLARLVKNMKKNRFLYTGDTIKISKSGFLLDGQYRLQSIINSGKVIEVIIATEIPDEAFLVCDIGKRRSINDNASVVTPAYNGLSHIGSITRYLYLYKEVGYIKFHHDRESIDHIDAGYIYEKYMSEIQYAIDFCNCKELKQLAAVSTLAFCFFILSRIDSHKAEYFFNRLRYGNDLKVKHPILMLRNRLLQELTHRRMPAPYVINLIFQTWKNFLDNKEVSFVRLPNHPIIMDEVF